jgi:hypothetical protein
MHLAHCPFGGQHIATHDAIKDLMYAFVRKNEHFEWKERQYALTLGISLRADLYMTHEH